MSALPDDRFMMTAADGDEGDRLLGVLRDMVVGIVRSEGADVSVRQLGVLLACYLDEDLVLTTSSLMRAMRGTRRSMNRALVRLEELDLVALAFDPHAPSELTVRTTAAGRVFVDRLVEPAGQSSGLLELCPA